MIVLYFGKELGGAKLGGRELLCQLNYDLLYTVFGDNLLKYSLKSQRQSGLVGLFNALRGHIDGIDKAQLDLVSRLILEKRVQKVFIDGSNLGSFVAALKHRHPNIESVTFFHNVEASFFWGSFLSRRSLKTFLVLLANWISETKAVKKSSKIVCLSHRDSRLLKHLYGRAATHISPIALKDSLSTPTIFKQQLPSERFALFVGGTFFANIKAVEWYAQHIAASVCIPLYVVGHGFELLRPRFKHISNMIIIGSVDSLSDWYWKSHVVVAPIFHGSGMKTKVAEALMHGKRVIGTPEAFSGYEDIGSVAGWCCRNSQEFIEAMHDAIASDLPSFDPQLRIIYDSRYSFEASRKRFLDILGETTVSEEKTDD